MKKVGVVGSGPLALSVAWRLMEVGYPVTVWGPDSDGVAQCVSSGAAAASGPSEVAAASEVVIIAAASAPDSEKFNLGDDGVVAALLPGAIAIDMTNMEPSLARRIAAACEERNAAFLDAPVSGGAPAARTGNLVIMVGGPERAFDDVLPILEPLGRTIVRVGETGAGATAKLCNQIMCFVNLCGVCEAFTLGAKAGIDLRKVFSIVTAGAAQSWELENMGPMLLSRQLEGGYPVRTSQHDLSLVLGAAHELKVALPATSLVHQLYHTVESEGLSDSGSQALIRALEKMAGVEVRW
jgi:3-hydroxyisobutyrate dehydrogenase